MLTVYFFRGIINQKKEETAQVRETPKNYAAQLIKKLCSSFMPSAIKKRILRKKMFMNDHTEYFPFCIIFKLKASVSGNVRIQSIKIISFHNNKKNEN